MSNLKVCSPAQEEATPQPPAVLVLSTCSYPESTQALPFHPLVPEECSYALAVSLITPPCGCPDPTQSTGRVGFAIFLRTFDVGVLLF